MKRIAMMTTVALLLAAAGLSLPSHAEPVPPAEPALPAGPATGPSAGPVHAIVLPTMTTELPPGPAAGRDTVGTACTFCHSARYVLNQPAFPRQTWLNEVNKMRTTYGAPVSEQQVQPIVDYLFSIRGVPGVGTRP